MRIKLSAQADKFLKKNQINDEVIVSYIDKFELFLKREKINLDIKRTKGKWKGAYRIRFGDTRMIIYPDIENNAVFIDKIDFRGNVYK
jgi:mRNA-degrading endonuclease RelE of RelBE toxin-antitoxin system